jgi:hypothetical protein
MVESHSREHGPPDSGWEEALALEPHVHVMSSKELSGLPGMTLGGVGMVKTIRTIALMHECHDGRSAFLP